ncbi:hypothetical protein AAFF_G00232480 [Aldrovandia affinis]|uniref:Uncharacterized protein n=1 Tax=Aldrovandia affinis TaxID=143900 RepID=A0AAD7RES3_9TELE|nr:hypothetical protein AAFF_G00232480 [Aldrovandia affinis]
MGPAPLQQVKLLLPAVQSSADGGCGGGGALVKEARQVSGSAGRPLVRLVSAEIRVSSGGADVMALGPGVDM